MGLISNNEYLISFISKDYKTMQYAKEKKITVSLFGFRICDRPFRLNILVTYIVCDVNTLSFKEVWVY